MVVGPPKVGKTTFLRTLERSIQSHEGAVVRPESRVETTSETTAAVSSPPRSDPTKDDGSHNSQRESKKRVALPGDEEPTLRVTAWPPLEIDHFVEKIQFAMIDTPGLLAGSPSYQEQLTEVLSDIESRFESTLVEEFKVQRNPRRALDTHVHVILYIVSPMSGLTDGEIPILRKLSSRANVIPCLGQADLITKRRMDRVKQSIMEKIRLNNIPVFAFSSEHDEEDDDGEKGEANERERGGDKARHLEASDVEEEDESRNLKKENFRLRESLPFTLIGSEPEDILLTQDESGRLVRMPSENSLKSSQQTLDPQSRVKRIVGREYNWGIIDVDNADHCDLSTLKYVLFTSHMYTLKERTRNIFYEKYRTERLLAHKASLGSSDTASTRSGRRSGNRSLRSQAPGSLPRAPGTPSSIAADSSMGRVGSRSGPPLEGRRSRVENAADAASSATVAAT